MSRSTSKVLYSMFRRFVGFILLLLAFLLAGCDLGSSSTGQVVSPTGTPLREAGAPTTSSAQSPETTRSTTTAMPTIQPQPTLAAGLSTAITDRDATG